MMLDAYTKSYLTFDGNLKEPSGREWTPTGAPVYVEGKFNQGLSFNGSSQYISTPASAEFAFNASPFTWEWWVRPTSHGVGLLSHYLSATTYGAVYITTTGAVSLLSYWSNTPRMSWSTADGVVLTNKKQHIAIVGDGTRIGIVIDGIFKPVTGSGYDFPNYGTTVHLGVFSGVGYFFNGMMDEFRVSSIARWTKNFKPPTRPYSLNQNTKVPPRSLLTLPSVSRL